MRIIATLVFITLATYCSAVELSAGYSKFLNARRDVITYSRLNPMIIDTSGRNIGHAKITTTNHGSLVAFTVCDLPAGWHAVHLHAVGECDDYARGFKNAGVHLNPYYTNHGFSHKESRSKYHLGDLANFYVHKDQCAQIEQLVPGLNSELLRRQFRGISLIIHERADDYSSQPSGDGGSRIACSVIKPK